MDNGPQSAGLYLHIPYCSAICPYCDFSVRTGKPDARAAFVDALIAEIGLWSSWSPVIDTVYFGGGTPSILETVQLGRILDAVRASLPVAADAHISLEANPEDVSAPQARAWRGLGIETVSLGVQSFDATELRSLGRRHTPEDAQQAVRSCIDAGFATVSVDLMFGLPGQSERSWQQSLDAVITLSPNHISCYQLTIHQGTPFARRQAQGRLCEMPENEQAALFECTHRVLGAAGFKAYEVSNFAVSAQHQSQHNRKYWRHLPYLGLGPSAHSFDGRRRWWNEADMKRYTEQVRCGQRPVSDGESLDAPALALEQLMLGLRTTEGVNLRGYRDRFGVDLIDANQHVLPVLVNKGLLRITDIALVPTLAGLAVADGMSLRLDTGLASTDRPL